MRVRSPKGAQKFGVNDVGGAGRLSYVAGYWKGKGWLAQSWRLNLADYGKVSEPLDTLLRLHQGGDITRSQYVAARKLVIRYFKRR